MSTEETEVYEQLLLKYGEVLNTREVQEKYSIEGFMAPYVVARRRSDNVKGSLEFTHMPRFYFNFVESSK
jgi:hypothetical protein